MKIEKALEILRFLMKRDLTEFEISEAEIPCYACDSEVEVDIIIMQQIDDVLDLISNLQGRFSGVKVRSLPNGGLQIYEECKNP